MRITWHSQRLGGAPEKLCVGHILGKNMDPLVPAQADEPWSVLLGAFALVGRHDPRPRVADSAASALLDCCCRHAGAWPGHVWGSVHGRAVAYLLDLPFARLAEGAVVHA